MNPKLRRTWTQRISIVFGIYSFKKTICSTQQQTLKTCCFHTNTSGFSTSSRKLRFTSRNHFKKYTNSGMPFVKGARLLSLKMEEVPFENNLRNCKRKMCTGALVVGPREIASTFIFFILLFIVFLDSYSFHWRQGYVFSMFSSITIKMTVLPEKTSDENNNFVTKNLMQQKINRINT